MGGPDHAYLTVAEKGCFTWSEGKHIYQVCLFDKVTYQLGEQGRAFVLGRNGTWAESFWENGQARLDFTHLTMGDGEWCHRASTYRKTELFFECAPEDVLVSIRETTTCDYLVQFETPA